jgi:endonuclease YncB( thermonuclease family)
MLTAELKNETLSIRIAGVDAPELAHFGNPAQPHAKESLQWLIDTVEGRRVKCELLRKDQYGRIVAVPWLKRAVLPDKPLPLMMLREGMAVVYTQGGAEFGPWGLDKLQAEEDDARYVPEGAG